MILDSLVDNSQNVFIKGCCILDNIATAEELIFSLHEGILQGHVIKVDFVKAFDIVDWDFLTWLVEACDFGNRWVGWVRSILLTSKANFLINGSHKGYV